MTLTTERLKDLTFHRSKLIFPASHEEAAAMARELLANREAQPVAVVITRGHLAHITDADLELGTKLYTAPPAPAVPQEISSAIRHLKDALVACNRFNYCADAVNRVEDACRAAMLAQPVSQGYKLPDGFKLMPLEMTDEIGEAIAMEARCCGGIALCIYEAALAASPESGNDHDTRR
ncbi:hypothetical protein I5R69_25645 [Serratia marcescens]|nr:hypothetical protein [Serratia marcescens]